MLYIYIQVKLNFLKNEYVRTNKLYRYCHLKTETEMRETIALISRKKISAKPTFTVTHLEVFTYECQ